jgi:hypothetical protein
MKRWIAMFASVLALTLVAAVAVAVARARGRPADELPAVGQTYVFVVDSADVAAEVLERPRGGWVKVRLLEKAGGRGAACGQRAPGETWINLQRVALIAAVPPGEDEGPDEAPQLPGPAGRPACQAPSL